MKNNKSDLLVKLEKIYKSKVNNKQIKNKNDLIKNNPNRVLFINNEKNCHNNIKNNYSSNKTSNKKNISNKRNITNIVNRVNSKGKRTINSSKYILDNSKITNLKNNLNKNEVYSNIINRNTFIPKFKSICHINNNNIKNNDDIYKYNNNNYKTINNNLIIDNDNYNYNKLNSYNSYKKIVIK